MSGRMATIAETAQRYAYLGLVVANEIWRRYGYFILGAIGWLLICNKYPFDWSLPKYAEF